MLRKLIQRASLRNNKNQMVGWDGIDPPTPGSSDLGPCSSGGRGVEFLLIGGELCG
jgi:hypothetical protein